MSAERPSITLEDLRVHARTASDGDEKLVLSLHDRFVSRVLAPPLAWLALKAGISADVLTLLSIILGLAAAVCLAIGNLQADVAAVILLQLSYLIDCADGDVARANGTAGIDGYLRDTFRHYLLGPGIFCGMTLAVHARHPDTIVIIMGLLATFFATRIVGDMEDRVTLDGLIRRLKKPEPATLVAAPRPPSALRSIVDWLRGLFLRDLSLMNWLTLGVLADVFVLRPRQAPWLAFDYLFFVLAAAQVLMKSVGLVLLWRRGVSRRVEEIAAEIAKKSQQ